MNMSKRFSKDVLNIDPAAVSRKIEETLRRQILHDFKKRGAIVALSGGIDSSVTTALCARALGPDRVLAVFLPERDSSDDSLRFGRIVAEKYGVKTVVEDIAPMLEAAGCYRRRDEAIRSQFPEYYPGYKFKIVLANILENKGGMNYFHIVLQTPEGEQKKVRLDLSAYLGIVAATNMKQRARKYFEYYHADRLNYAVAGTPNRLEYDQGFFVKNGDGAADVKPIAHLYKSQVYQLAAYLGMPEEVLSRMPTTDTYSLPQTQEEFYFSLPYKRMDLCLYAKNEGYQTAEVAPVIGLTAEQVERVYQDIDRKRGVAKYLSSPPLLIEPIHLGA
jgi:NAD+ synthase